TAYLLSGWFRASAAGSCGAFGDTWDRAGRRYVRAAWRGRSREIVQECVAGPDAGQDRRDARVAGHLAHVAALRFVRERHDDAAGAGARRASRPMEKRLRLGGRVDVY